MTCQLRIAKKTTRWATTIQKATQNRNDSAVQAIPHLLPGA